GIAARMGQAIHDTGADRISDGREHDGRSAADMLQRCHGEGAAGQDDVRRERDQFCGIFCALVRVILAPAGVNPYIAANTPAQFLLLVVSVACIATKNGASCPLWVFSSDPHAPAARGMSASLQKPTN